MLKLGVKHEPMWLDLPLGVRVYVRPLTPAIYQTAQAHGVREVLRLVEHQAAIHDAGGRVDDLPDMDDEDARTGLSQVIFAECLAQSAILEWDGVIDLDDEPAEVTTDHVTQFMNDPLMNNSFLTRYCASHERLVREGKPSGLSPNGTLVGALDTVADAAPRASPAPLDGLG